MELPKTSLKTYQLEKKTLYFPLIQSKTSCRDLQYATTGFLVSDYFQVILEANKELHLV